MSTTEITPSRLEELLGDEAELLLNHRSQTLDKANLHLPGPDFVDRVFLDSDRSTNMLAQLQWLINSRPAGGHRLRVDPAGRSGHRAFRRRFVRAQPAVLRSREHRQAGRSKAAATRSPRRSACSAPCAASTRTRFPFIVKLNHNELLTYPNKYDQIMFGSVEQAWNMGAAGVGATIYFGSEQSRRGRSWRSREAFEQAHELGHGHGALVLPAQLRLQDEGRDYHVAADLTGQANHLGVTIQADIIKQKLPENNGGYNALSPELRQDPQEGLRRAHARDNPIDLTRYQVANCYTSDGPLSHQLLSRPRRPDQQWRRSSGESDLAEAVRTAVINKRAGGMGLITGRKAFQRPMDEGVALLQRHPGRVPGRRDHGGVSGSRDVRYGVHVPNMWEYGDPRVIARAGRDRRGLWLGRAVRVGPRPVRPRVAAARVRPVDRPRGRGVAHPAHPAGRDAHAVARRRPWKLAREVASLDVLSEGRVVFGAGLGVPADAEFEAYGEDGDPLVRRGKLDEGLELLRLLWSGEPVSYSGEHYNVSEVTFLPTPVQERLPVWVGGTGRPSARSGAPPGWTA